MEGKVDCATSGYQAKTTVLAQAWICYAAWKLHTCATVVAYYMCPFLLNKHFTLYCVVIQTYMLLG